MDTPDFTIRPGRDTDAAGFMAVIGACWSEYPGIVFDVDAELPELHALATYYAAKGGALWAAEADAQVVGMIAVAPRGEDAWEICRLYVLAAWRGTTAGRGAGLAHCLLDQAEAHARAASETSPRAGGETSPRAGGETPPRAAGATPPRAAGATSPRAAGATRLVLWSDTRFERAHRFYERRGYVRAGPIRVLNDLSNSLEFGYAKLVDGIAVLDAAAAASAERCLAAVLMACVADGASVGFLPPVAPDVAHAFWRQRASEVATGGRTLIAGWADGALVGCVTLDLDTPANQRHRAEVQTLLVHPAARRHGLGRALMQRLEVEAARHGRTLLTLNTNAGDTNAGDTGAGDINAGDTGASEPAETLFRALGWLAAGRIPDYARKGDGTSCDTRYFYKCLMA